MISALHIQTRSHEDSYWPPDWSNRSSVVTEQGLSKPGSRCNRAAVKMCIHHAECEACNYVLLHAHDPPPVYRIIAPPRCAVLSRLLSAYGALLLMLFPHDLGVLELLVQKLGHPVRQGLLRQVSATWILVELHG